MTFPKNAKEIVKTYGAGRATKHPHASVVIVECGVLVRHIYHPGGWVATAENFMKLIVSKYTDQLKGCETLVCILDTYDRPAEHRRYVEQVRSRTKDYGPPVNPQDYWDLEGRNQSPFPDPKVFSKLFNNRKWRQERFIPFLTRNLKFPASPASLKRVLLRGFVFPQELITPSPPGQDPPVSEYLDLGLDASTGETTFHHVHDVSDEQIKLNSSEGDHLALSFARYALKSGKTVNLVSGDGDLWPGSIILLERLLWEKAEELDLYDKKTRKIPRDKEHLADIPVPEFHLYLDTELGLYDVVACREGMISNLMNQLFMQTPHIPDPIQSQIPILVCLFAFLGENDTATPIPYVTAPKIAEALGPYISSGGRFLKPPPLLMSKDGTTSLLPMIPRAHSVFFYRDAENNLCINYVAWLSLIQRAAGFDWAQTVRSPETHAAPLKSKPKVVSVAWVMAHLLRLNFTLNLFWQDHVPGTVLPEFGGEDEMSGYVLDTETRSYELVTEHSYVRETLETLKDDLHYMTNI